MTNEIRWEQRFENLQQSIKNIDETCECIKKEGLNNIYTMALIQAFEICYELAWKTMKDYLEYDGIKTTTPRDTIKSAFTYELIQDGHTWIEMMESRNKTSHTYQEPFARALTTEILNKYIPLIKSLEIQLKERCHG